MSGGGGGKCPGVHVQGVGRGEVVLSQNKSGLV